MKNARIIAVLALLALSLSGCANTDRFVVSAPPSQETVTTEPAQNTVPREQGTVPVSESTEIPAESTEPTEIVEAKSEVSIPAKEETPPTVNIPTETTQPKASEPEPSEEPAETRPQEPEPPAAEETTAEPAEEPEETMPEDSGAEPEEENAAPDLGNFKELLEVLQTLQTRKDWKNSPEYEMITAQKAKVLS